MEKMQIEAKIPDDFYKMVVNLTKDIAEIKAKLSQNEKLIALEDFQKNANVSRQTIYNWIRNNEIETVKIGGRRLVKINNFNNNGVQI
jgi:predicted DNA-binding transcriptional regulator AlpA